MHIFILSDILIYKKQIDTFVIACCNTYRKLKLISIITKIQYYDNFTLNPFQRIT